MALKTEDRQKGGRSQTPKERTFYRNRELAREAGKKGGIKAQEIRRQKREAENDANGK